MSGFLFIAHHERLSELFSCPSLAVPYYLMSLYLYERGVDGLTDAEFDAVCDFIAAEWGSIEHEHKHLINRWALSAHTTTGYDVSELPQRVRSAALQWVIHLRNDRD